jgi:NitT/TauT family transport system permease protein
MMPGLAAESPRASAQRGSDAPESLSPEQITRPNPTSATTPLLHRFSLVAACTLALLIHQLSSGKEPVEQTQLYFWLLGFVLVCALVITALPGIWSTRDHWLKDRCPLLAGALLLVSAWELVTSGWHWLPMPYFPGPAGVLQSLISDRVLLFESTWHSLLLLVSGYALGASVALVTGVCIGWSACAHYWGMPLLKIIGPIPATAWIPLAMVISPSAIFSGVVLIALAVWFPVTMLTASGISNTRAAYLDVARTLGARQSYLIFHVAIPAAMPSIFIGLFMGLGTSFLTLVVAETVGVKSGLGYYVSWAQGWAEYGKVYAALLIMAAFFSTIMTVLFKVRDRVLSWQKGTIKW